jgi:hypothetical protein
MYLTICRSISLGTARSWPSCGIRARSNDAAMEPDPILRYKKVQRVFEDLYADRSRLLPIVVDTFIGTIGQQGAKQAFEVALINSTTTQIEPKGFKLIRDIPCLILWVKMIDLYHLIATPLTFCITFLMRDLR